MAKDTAPMTPSGRDALIFEVCSWPDEKRWRYLGYKVEVNGNTVMATPPKKDQRRSAVGRDWLNIECPTL
jgi:hypothetical protein